MSPIEKKEKVLTDDGRSLASLAGTTDVLEYSSLLPRFSLLVLLLATLAILAGCGSSTPNSRATFNTASQQHAADWLPAGHATAAQKDPESCTECHGRDFLGGISRVACARCHLGGPESKHPADWIQDQVTEWSKHAEFAAGLGTDACANAACHGSDLSGAVQSGPSCTNCHLDGVNSKHPRDWGQHAAALHAGYTLTNGGAKCANDACHGQNLTGVTGSGPACEICHTPPPHEVTVDRTSGCSACHPANGLTSKMFHPWNAPNALNHGAYALTTGTGSCAVAACHGADLTGGENCPSCTSCHLGGKTAHHPQDWGANIIIAHQTYVGANGTGGCANAACHGTNLLGGATGPSCTTCHLGGVVTKHPVDFGGTPALNHSSFVAANTTAGCAVAACHGANLLGGTAGPSCTSCHLGGTTVKHPASFGTTTTTVALNHKAYVDANGAEGCKNGWCHGATMTGVAGSGPGCSTTACHQRGYPVLGNTPTLTNCASCHDRPPTGTAAPNRRGAHADHNALAGVTNVCNTCHTSAGTGTANHFNGTINVQFGGATFDAKSGAAVRNADGTCSRVSCHGGQTTPAWLTGTISVSAQCTLCHEHATVADEYNSYSGPLHLSHITEQGFGCTACHDAAKLPPNHFATLNTTAMEGPASATMNVNFITSYDPQTKSCNANCHPGDRMWQ